MKTTILATIGIIFLLACNEASQKNEHITLDYHLIKSDKNKKLFVLLGGYGQNLKQVRSESSIVISTLINCGYSVLLLNTSELIIYDETEINNLIKHINKILSQHNLSLFGIGGFSLGGFGAAKIIPLLRPHHENCKNLLLVDSPLDLKRFVNSLNRQVTNHEPISRNEAKYIIEIINEYSLKNSIALDSLLKKESVIQQEANEIRLEQHLLDIQLYIFSSSDINWSINNRQRTIYDMHIFDLSFFTLYLNKLGNYNTHLCTQYHKNTKPHSWDIVNVDTLKKWIK